MSSHHVVREAQEPAFLILHSQFLSAPHVGPLLEWSPTIVVVEEALQEVVGMGIKADVVVFQKDQAERVEVLLQGQMPVSLVPLNEEESSILKALSFLAGKGHQAVTILTSSAMDYPDLLQQLAEQRDIPNVVLLDGEEKTSLCRSGNFTKWYPAGEVVKIKPAAAKLMLSTRGFVENAPDTEVHELKPYKTKQAATISLKAGEPFWLIEQLA